MCVYVTYIAIYYLYITTIIRNYMYVFTFVAISFTSAFTFLIGQDITHYSITVHLEYPAIAMSMCALFHYLHHYY